MDSDPPIVPPIATSATLPVLLGGKGSAMPGILTPTIGPRFSGVALTSGRGGVTGSGATTPPVVTQGRVQIASPATDWFSANKTLHGGATETTGQPDSWVVPGGDYIDTNGVVNGPAHARSVPIANSTTATINIAGINGDLFITGVRMLGVATIDGVAATAFWVDATTNHSIPITATAGSGANRAIFIQNPLRGTTLSLPIGTGGTALIDAVAGPLINALPMTGASNVPNIWELDCTSDAAILNHCGATVMAGGTTGTWAFNREYGTDQSGLHYLRFSSVPASATQDAAWNTANTNGAYSRLISWKPGLGLPTTLPVPHVARDACYARWCLYIEPDVETSFNELGMKLPGLNNDTSGQSTTIALRCEHSPPGVNNGGLFGLLTYDYSASSGSGFGVIDSGNALLRTGQWYVFEQYAQMNTVTGSVGNADGIQKLWINGNLCMNKTNVVYRNNADNMDTLFVNVYHGGLGAPRGLMHYRIAKIAVSTAPIGIPPELQPASVPSWVPSVGSIANVSLNTMNTVNPCPANNCNYSGVTKQASVYNDTGVQYAPLLGAQGSIIATGGGHNDYYGNEVYRYDLATRLWTMITTPHNVLQATSPPLAAGDVNIGYHADRVWGEQWADSTFTTTLQNQPSAGHLYGYPCIVPVGTKGSLLTPCRPAMTPIGSGFSRGAHILDLDAQVTAGSGTSLWQRASPNLNASLLPGYGGAVYDARRNRIWGTESTGTAGNMWYLDLVSKTWTYTNIPFGAFYGTLMRSETQDRMLYMRMTPPGGTADFGTGIEFRIINPNLTGSTAINRVSQTVGKMTGTLPPYDSVNSPLGGGCDWCEDLPGGAGFVYYGGGGERDVYICQPTGDFNTGVWNWTKQTLAPVTGADAPVIQLSPSQCTHLHRFVYVPVARCFLWMATNTSAVSAWRLFS